MSSPAVVEQSAACLVRPLPGRVVAPSWAARVVSPMHDELTEEERRAALRRNPDSYLHVTSEPAAPDPGAQARALRRLVEAGAYDDLAEPRILGYRMRGEAGEHVGLVAGVDLDGFVDGRVLGHESVQPARVESLVRHHARVPLRSELVALLHRADADIARLTDAVCDGVPLLHFVDDGGLEQTVWRADATTSDALAEALGTHRLYIADGHHRVAAALTSWQREGRPPGTVLCALYPPEQVTLHAFHRRVAGPVDVPGLLDALTGSFAVADAGPETVPGSVSLYAAGRWLGLTPLDPPAPTRSAGVSGLDVTVLDERVLRPLLGVGPGDPRVEFVPGLRDLAPTLRACDEDGGVLFALHAPGFDDLVAVAERHETMSAKTTYVRPKPRTGLFLV